MPVEVVPCRTNTGGQGNRMKPSRVFKPMQPMGIRSVYANAVLPVLSLVCVWVKYGAMLRFQLLPRKQTLPQFPVAALCSAGFSQQLGTCHWIPITQVTQVTRHHREGNGHLRNGRCADPVQP